MLTEQDIIALTAHPETEHVEMKRARHDVPETFWETYSSFANTDGGTILLGIPEHSATFTIEGVEAPDHLKKVIWDTLNNPEKVSANILFNRNIYTVDCSGRPVLVVEVPRADRTDRPLFIGTDVFRGTYRRNGEGDYLCSREAVEAMIRDRGTTTADQTVLTNLLVSDLNAETIRRYRTDFSSHRPHHAWNDLPNDEFLLKIGAAGRAEDRTLHPNVAGLVLFGDFATILSVLPNFFLDYKEYFSGETRWSDRVVSGDPAWSGNVMDFFYRLYDKIVADVKLPFALQADGFHRIDETDMHKSVRESLANALIHADYHGRQGVVIERSFMSLDIANPGVLRIPREEAIEGGRSDPRNASIFNIFSLISVGDRAGTGLCDLYSRWHKLGLPRPVLTESFDPARTQLSLSFTSTGEEKRKGREKVEKRVFSTKEKASLSTLPASVRAIHQALSANPNLTYAGLKECLGFSTATIAKAIGTLVSLGYLSRIGGRKDGKWQITPAPSPCSPRSPRLTPTPKGDRA